MTQGDRTDLPDCSHAADFTVQALNGVVTGDKHRGFPVVTTVGILWWEGWQPQRRDFKLLFKVKGKTSRSLWAFAETSRLLNGKQSSHCDCRKVPIFYQCPQLTQLFLNLKMLVFFFFFNAILLNNDQYSLLCPDFAFLGV